jgi:hypothetical protein
VATILGNFKLNRQEGRRGRPPTASYSLLLVIREQKSRKGCRGLWACEILRLPHCLDSRLTDGGDVSVTSHPAAL